MLLLSLKKTTKNNSTVYHVMFYSLEISQEKVLNNLSCTRAKGFKMIERLGSCYVKQQVVITIKSHH